MHHTQPRTAGKTPVNHYLRVTSWPNRSVANVILAFSLLGFLWPHHAAAGNQRHHTKTRTQASTDAPQTNANELTDSDSTAFFVYGGKLYVRSAADTAKEFRSNIDENMRNADENLVTHFGWHGNPPLR